MSTATSTRCSTSRPPSATTRAQRVRLRQRRLNQAYAFAIDRERAAAALRRLADRMRRAPSHEAAHVETVATADEWGVTDVRLKLHELLRLMPMRAAEPAPAGVPALGPREGCAVPRVSREGRGAAGDFNGARLRCHVESAAAAYLRSIRLRRLRERRLPVEATQVDHVRSRGERHAEANPNNLRRTLV